jgi:hypothetical protein
MQIHPSTLPGPLEDPPHDACEECWEHRGVYTPGYDDEGAEKQLCESCAVDRQAGLIDQAMDRDR